MVVATFFQFSGRVTVDSILACDPSYANQFVCLCLAAIAMNMLIYVLARNIAALIRRLDLVKSNLLTETIDSLKNEEFAHFIISDFNKWSKKKGKGSTIIKPTFEEILKSGGSNQKEWVSRDEAVDAYMTSERREMWMEYVIDTQSGGLAMSMQHMVSGIFALLALTSTDNQESFLTLARWSVLFEAGWEAFDTVGNIIIPLIRRKFNFGSIILGCHHVVLYLFLPLNQILLPSGIGRDVATCFILCAGLVGPLGTLNFIKNNVDSSSTNGKLVFMTLQIVISASYVITRGPCWFYLAYRMLKYSWNDGTTWPLFLLLVLATVLFSLFNLIIIHFCWKGMRNAVKKMKGSAADENDAEDTTVPKMSRRPTMQRKSSILDLVAQEANMSRRSSLKRSISLMGVDYTLDDEEVITLDRCATVRRSRMLSIPADIKEE